MSISYDKFKEKYKLQLDRQQDEAVRQINGPQLILAVPGSGKTTVLVSRLGYMIYGMDISPESILTVTYTVAATRDMRERYQQFFGPEYADRLEFRTINGISQKILTYYGICTGKTPFAVADKEVNSIVREAFKNVNQSFPTDNDVSNILTAIGYAKNMGLTDSQIQKQKVDVDNFYAIYKKYNEILRSRSMIDYDDQMVYALKILSSVPQVLEYFQNCYKYILVDEAQDTSKIQHEIIALLASKSRNLFMVGDEDQSIYGFRAAYPEALIDFPKKYQDANIHLMETNYRSGKDIVAAANMIISQNTQRFNKQLVASKEFSGKVSRLDTSLRKNQYKYIAEHAINSDKRVAILYRNNESALPLIDMLERYGINYRLKNSDATFFSHPVINDIRDFIRLAKNPCDDEAFMRIYYKMNVGISKIVAQGAVYNCGSEGMLEYIGQMDSVNSGIKKRCKSLSSSFHMLGKENAKVALDRIVGKMGYGKFMENRCMDTGKLEILKMLALQVKNLDELVARLDILQGIMMNGSDSSDARIILSTVHSAKGLEFDIVYMMDMVENVLPCCKKPGRYASKEEIDAFEEERRLFYVAMTRARKELYIFTFDYDTTSQFSRELFGMQKPKDAIVGKSHAVSGTKSPILRTNYGKARPAN